ncbi:MAG: ParB/RepB/Spo0J family partition protein [Treponema sp.]|nr:ParB/RepB/Spo0J family partition protein [Treponema sp.]
MAFKHGLGKGLGALIPVDDESPQPSAQGIPIVERAVPDEISPGREVLVPLEKLRAHPNQPRRYFDDGSLQELADSIRQHGVIQPIIAEDAGDGTYIIVAGERRTRAAALADLTHVPVLIRNYTDEKRLEVSLIENIQRTDLNPIEEAWAYKRLMELTGLSQDEVASKVGKKRSSVANTIRLLKLPQVMQESLKTGELSPGHARSLLSVIDSACQEKLFRKILAAGASVREAEKLAATCNRAGGACNSSQSSKTKPAVPKRDSELTAMEEKFIESLGTKVRVEGDFHKGSIRIDYYSIEDLNRLYEILVR